MSREESSTSKPTELRRGIDPVVGLGLIGFVVCWCLAGIYWSWPWLVAGSGSFLVGTIGSAMLTGLRVQRSSRALNAHAEQARKLTRDQL